MPLPTIDYATLTDAEVTQLKSEASLEEQRRIRVSRAPAEAEALSLSYLEAVGRDQGSAWVQPQGAHDCYPLGYTVLHNERNWESLVPANVWEPGTSPTLWKDLTVIPEPPDGEAPAWSDAAVAYAVNDEVTFESNTYKCLQAHTSQAGWTPVAVPALWELVP